VPAATRRAVLVCWWWIGDLQSQGTPVTYLLDGDVVLSTTYEHRDGDTPPRLTLVIERNVPR
jgi:hypothetical protein